MVNLTPKLSPKGWDEMFSKEGVRDAYKQVLQTLESLTIDKLNVKQKQASDIFIKPRYHLHSL
ncbi:hypothetical protein [Flavobacterium nitratireducens]|uniref:hypothetical protein n=1 Tax=Flavobacterium nitratireducens TaxID=992289 RepID=UPI002414F366|nr:hypothetical protein [Flavobacterium nitratireducens]